MTGKGGTGKSTVAAALALALASQGKDVLLCEVEGRQGIARMFDVDPLPYAERRIATGAPDQRRRPGWCTRCTSTPKRRSWSTSSMYYRLGRAGRALDRFGVIEFATTIAPGRARRAADRQGLRGGAAQQPQQAARSSTTPSCSTRRRPAGSRQFLNVSDELAGLAKVGPIKNQADTMMTLFRSPRTAVHFVTVLEEMPVQETADGIAHLREAGLPGRRRGREPGPPARPAGQGPRRGAQGRAGPGRDRLRPGRRRRGRVGRPAGRAARRGPRPRRSAGRWRTPSASWSRGWACRRTSCPGWPRGVDMGGLYELAGGLRDQGMA